MALPLLRVPPIPRLVLLLLLAASTLSLLVKAGEDETSNAKHAPQAKQVERPSHHHLEQCSHDSLAGHPGLECPVSDTSEQWYGNDYFNSQILPSQAQLHPLLSQGEQQQQQGKLLKRQDPPASQSVNVPQNAPVGGLTITQPPNTAQATYYKIARDNFVTFGWSFTDLVVTPQRLVLQAYCSQNGFTYPVGPTQGIAGDSTQYAWDPHQYEQGGGATPLAEASYTLRIFDERGYGAAPSGGYLRTYIGTVFALYRPQPYQGLADGWTCAACSAAARSLPIHTAVVATALSCMTGMLLVFVRLQ